jgi:O-methyltransferase
MRSEPKRAGAGVDEVRRLYLDLLEKAVLHTLYWPPDARQPPEYVKEAYTREFERLNIKFVLPSPEENRAHGRDWPVYAQTMVGVDRLRNVRECVESVLVDEVPGDLIEAGCWRGGVAILMRGILAAHGIDDRCVFAADSFQGLPEPDPERYPADEGDLNYTAEELAVGVDEVRGHFERYGLLDEQVRFVEGWFRETLPGLRDRRWAVVRLDGDMYESTIDGLTNLYPQLSVGGYLIIDDYRFDNCAAAVHDYRREHGITEEIVEIDWTGAYWRRER